MITLLNIFFALAMVAGWGFNNLFAQVIVYIVLAFFGIVAAAMLYGVFKVGNARDLLQGLHHAMEKSRIFTYNGVTKKRIYIDSLTYDLPFAVCLTLLGAPGLAIIYATIFGTLSFFGWLELDINEPT